MKVSNDTLEKLTQMNEKLASIILRTTLIRISLLTDDYKCAKNQVMEIRKSLEQVSALLSDIEKLLQKFSTTTSLPNNTVGPGKER